MTCESWPIVWPCPIEGISDDVLNLAHGLAVDLLQSLSGSRLGICSYTEAYRPAGTSGGCAGPYKDSTGNWRNGATWSRDCCRLLLSHRPVIEVCAVWDRGNLVDPTGYDVESGWLRRRGACWSCGDACDDPPVAVSYRAGAPYPSGTAVAVGEVACEYVAALENRPCKLPSRAVSIIRQGVTVNLGSADEAVSRGRLGLPIADAWLTAVNRRGLVMASRVYSPDLPRSSPARVVVGP